MIKKSLAIIIVLLFLSTTITISSTIGNASEADDHSPFLMPNRIAAIRYLPVIRSLDRVIHPLDGSPLEPSDEDLEVLAYMSDCKIVGLGEATHGTKEFFQLKHRIFKYLVENHGFKIFAFECDMGESYYVDNFVTKGEGDIDYIMKNIMIFWTWRTEEVKELLLWMREYNEDKSNKEKIHFIGVDCRYIRYHSDIILDYFKKTNISLTQDCLEFLNEIKKLKPENRIDFIKLGFYYRFMTANKKIKFDYDLDVLISELEDSKDELIANSSEFEYQFVKQLALNIKQVHNSNWIGYQSKHSDLNYWVLRDLYMTENTLWTSDLFGENTKVAVWAHNDHVKNLESWMGFYLKKELNNDYQTIGFSFSCGSFIARPGIYKLKIVFPPQKLQIKHQPKIGSINYVFHRAKYDNFILRDIDIQESSDFDNYISQPQPFFMFGGVFSRLLHFLGFDYELIYLKEMFDVVINWDITEAAEPLS